MQSTENQEYKIGYKKVYSDLYRAALNGIAFRDFPEREKKYDYNTTLEEWSVLKKQFGVAKLCENSNAFDCWVDEERLCIGCGAETNSGVPRNDTKIFIDLSGRAWALYTTSENIFLVDVNGEKKPNHFGKDRWIFTFAGEDGNRICSEGSSKEGEDPCPNPGIPLKVIPLINRDITNYDSHWCQYPPCRYNSWLLK